MRSYRENTQKIRSLADDLIQEQEPDSAEILLALVRIRGDGGNCGKLRGLAEYIRDWMKEHPLNYQHCEIADKLESIAQKIRKL